MQKVYQKVEKMVVMRAGRSAAMTADSLVGKTVDVLVAGTAVYLVE